MFLVRMKNGFTQYWLISLKQRVAVFSVRFRCPSQAFCEIIHPSLISRCGCLVSGGGNVLPVLPKKDGWPGGLGGRL